MNTRPYTAMPSLQYDAGSAFHPGGQLFGYEGGETGRRAYDDVFAHMPPQLAYGQPSYSPSFGYPQRQPQPQAGPSRPTTAEYRPDTASSVASDATVTGPPRQAPFKKNQGDEAERKKRPRRAFHEIERIYNCNYPGCTKACASLDGMQSDARRRHAEPPQRSLLDAEARS